MATRALARRGGRFVAARRAPRILRVRGPRRRAQTTIPLAVVAGLVPGVTHVWSYRASGVTAMAAQTSAIYTGFRPGDRRWYPADMAVGLGPLLVGFAVHYGASKLGINRMLGRARIPLVRV